MAIDRGIHRPDQNGWVVLYPGPKIVVTTWWVDTPAGRYPVAQLSDVTRIEVDGHSARSAALFAGALELLISLPFAVLGGSALMVVAGLLAAFGIGVGVLVDSRRNPRWMALRARYLGREVELFSTTYQPEFERVRLAVIRAVEAGRYSRPFG
jgi:uncharacterized protein DUF6232